MHRQLSETMIQTQSWALEVSKLFTFTSGKNMQGESLLSSCFLRSFLKHLLKAPLKDRIWGKT